MEIANLADNEKDQANMSKFLKYYTVFKNAPVLVLVYLFFNFTLKYPAKNRIFHFLLK